MALDQNRAKSLQDFRPLLRWGHLKIKKKSSTQQSARSVPSFTSDRPAIQLMKDSQNTDMTPRKDQTTTNLPSTSINMTTPSTRTWKY